MGINWSRRKPGAHSTQRTRPRRHLEFTVLEDRRAPAIGVVTAVAVPKLLVPPNGAFVPVTVSGTFPQVINFNLPGLKAPPPPAQLAKIDAFNARQPAPNGVLVQVTDQYRRVEPHPRVPVTLLDSTNVFAPATKFNPNGDEALVRHFAYTFTIFLQAKRSTNLPQGRHYYINVSAADEDGAEGSTIDVFVPVNPANPHGVAARRIPRQKTT